MLVPLAVATFLGRRRGFSSALLAGTLVAAQPALGWWAVTGMETPLVVLLVTLIAIGALASAPWTVTIAGALVAIARPEGPLFLRWRAGDRASLLRHAVVGLSPLIAWHLYRFFVYGTLLPNTALAKLGTTPKIGDARSAFLGLDYVASSAETSC